jgi:wyosine [tRNA(Phe)-imidazoG37] synthetase (radical SAM superfamily)
VIPEIKKVLLSGQRIDYITLSGSGEPTLNSAIGKTIREIKKMSSIPVAVLTNSTLLTQKKVRIALLAADPDIPSLDAATQDLFLRINRPHPTLKIEAIIEGIRKFRQEFKGSIWLEVMLVKGINDSPGHIKKLKEAIAEINPDRIQLNTVIRPPAEKNARPLSLGELKRIKQILGQKCEIIVPFERKEQPPVSENSTEAIHSLIQRRPVTLSEIASSLGKHQNEVIKHLNTLLEEDKVKAVVHRGQRYYEPI